MTDTPSPESAAERITIRSEEEAWHWLQRATSDDDFPASVELVFDGWPTYDMHVSGSDWHSTVPTRVMMPMLEVQRDIYRAYTKLWYGTPSLNRLTDNERERLELLLRVDEGSSDFTVDMWKQLSLLAEKALEKMDGRDVTITVLGLAVTWGCTVVAKAWIARRQEASRTEVTVKLSEQETERMKLVTSAIRIQPAVAEAQADYAASQNRLLKTVKPDDSVEIKGVALTGGQAKDITLEERAHARETHIAGIFRILSNDTSKQGYFRIKVARVDDGLQFSADVPLELSELQKELIRDAEWSQGNVYLEIRAEVLRDRISEAVVYGAGALSEEGEA